MYIAGGTGTVAEPFTDPEAARRYVTAGNARLTLRSKVTGLRYTYQVRKNANEDRDKRPSFFVGLLKGPDNTSDYTYIGMIRGDDFFTTKATRHMESAAFVRGFAYVYKRLVHGVLPGDAEVWHLGKCGRCGRDLTVPESVASGLGPECRKH